VIAWRAWVHDQDQPKPVFAVRDPAGPVKAWQVKEGIGYSIEVQQRWHDIEALHYKSEQWGESDGRFLDEMMRLPVRVPAVDEDTTRADAESIGCVTRAITACAERVAAGLPIERDVGKRLFQRIEELLRHPHWLVRQHALLAVNWTGMALDAQVAAKVKALENDPKPIVAAMARGVGRNLKSTRMVEQWRKIQERQGH
jgi:hypothetical protein